MYQEWMELIPILGPIMQICPHCQMKIEAKEIFCTYCTRKVR